MELYPLIEKHPDKIRSKTGKKLDDIKLEKIINDELSISDISISKETLLIQAQVALDAKRPQLAKNFVRASELINIPDEEILEIYNSLRPNRSSKEELEDLIVRLKNEYSAPICAELVKETLEVYIKRDLLK